MRGFTYDEFTKPTWNPAWNPGTSLYQAKPTWRIVDGAVRVTMPAGDATGLGCYFWAFQGHWRSYPEWPAPDLVMIPDDMFCKFTFPATLPEAPAWGYNLQFYFYDTWGFNLWEGDLGAWFVWENGASGWQWYAEAWADWDEYGEFAEATPIPVGNPSEGWLRLKSPPGEVTKPYYSLTDPKFESDWIEIVFPANGYIKPTGTFGEFVLSVQGDAEYLVEDTDFFIDYLRPWVDNSLHRQMTADLESIFYNVEEAAEEIIYEPRGQDPVGIRAVLLTQDDVLSDPGIMGDFQRIRVRSRDIPTPGRDSLILHGKRWFVLRNVGGGPHIGEWELEISKGETRIL